MFGGILAHLDGDGCHLLLTHSVAELIVGTHESPVCCLGAEAPGMVVVVRAGGTRFTYVGCSAKLPSDRAGGGAIDHGDGVSVTLWHCTTDHRKRLAHDIAVDQHVTGLKAEEICRRLRRGSAIDEG